MDIDFFYDRTRLLLKSKMVVITIVHIVLSLMLAVTLDQITS